MIQCALSQLSLAHKVKTDMPENKETTNEWSPWSQSGGWAIKRLQTSGWSSDSWRCYTICSLVACYKLPF